MRLASGIVRRAITVLLAAGLAGITHAAEPIPDQSPRIESLDAAQAEQERLRKMLEGKPEAYVDRVMDPSTLPAMTEPDNAAGADGEGFHSVVLETRFGTATASSNFEQQKASELGQHAEYRLDTVNYGEIVGQFDGRYANGVSGIGVGQIGAATKTASGRMSLRDIGLPITATVGADAALGDTYTEVTDALRRAYRLSLGSGVVRGVSARVFDPDFDLRAGTGSRGNLVGGPYVGFEPSGGSVTWLGYSRRLAGAGFAGIQFDRAQGVPLYAFSTPATASSDITSLAAAIGFSDDMHVDGSSKARLVYVRSQSSAVTLGPPRGAQGWFFEGGLHSGGFRHELGVFTADPALYFGDYLLPSDSRGAYWRVERNMSRLSWGLGIDWARQGMHQEAGGVPADQGSVNADAQYRISRADLIGGHLTWAQTTYRQSGVGTIGPGLRSLNAAAYYQTRIGSWPRTRFSAIFHRNEAVVANDVPATGEELDWEQDWITGKYETLRPELSTVIGMARDRSNGTTETRPTAGVSFRAWPGSDWSIGGRLTYSSRRSNLTATRGLSGTVSTERVLARGWRIGAALSLNQAIVNNSASALQPPQVLRSNDKSLSVYLRWEMSGGSTARPAGLRTPGAAGGGSLAGTVYFDANRDGEQQPNENGVPNVEVVLDGRYRITTDRDGHFEFPLVATGRHQLTLTLETVPLPWGQRGGESVSIDVPLRGQATARIPVVRVGE